MTNYVSSTKYLYPGVYLKESKMTKELTQEEKSTNHHTREHIAQVQDLVLEVVTNLLHRGQQHDASKLEHPEVEGFTQYTPRLAELTYGSPEYKETLAAMQDTTLKHHYEHNRHHPEHFKMGVMDMNLIDLIEMICDWKAATLRHKDGSITKSLEINRERFDIREPLASILENTVRDLGWD